MKKLAVLVLGAGLAVGSWAQAQVTGADGSRVILAERAQKVATHLKDVEAQLSSQDYEEVRFALDRLELSLSRYQKKEIRMSLSCISNGSDGEFERFKPTDLATRRTMGGGTSLASCRRLVEQQVNGMMCVSNGSDGEFERFVPWNLKIHSKVGGGTGLDSCLTLIAKSTAGYMCVSNGSDGEFENFTLRDLKTGSKVGGGTSLENCLAAIPR